MAIRLYEIVLPSGQWIKFRQAPLTLLIAKKALTIDLVRKYQDKKEAVNLLEMSDADIADIVTMMNGIARECIVEPKLTEEEIAYMNDMDKMFIVQLGMGAYDLDKTEKMMLEAKAEIEAGKAQGDEIAQEAPQAEAITSFPNGEQ